MPLIDRLAAFIRARWDDDELFLRTILDLGQQRAAAGDQADVGHASAILASFLSDPRAQALVERWGSGDIDPPNHAQRLLREIETRRAILHLCETETPKTGGQPLATRIMLRYAADYRSHQDYPQAAA